MAERRPSLEDRVARALAGESAENPIFAASWLPKAQDLIAALTPDDLKTLLQSRSDEVVVTLDAEELAQAARWCDVIGAPLPKNMKRVAAAQESLRSKLSTALESE